MSNRAKTATYDQDLVYVDGPQLILLKSDRNRPMFGVAIRRGDMDDPFFVCELRDASYVRYSQGKADLRYVFENALGNNYYFLDLSRTSINSIIELTSAKREEASNQQYWPDRGFFCDYQNVSLKNEVIKEESRRTFRINGRWEAEDFSRFHGKMADLYSIFAMIKRLSHRNSAHEKAYITSAIQTRLWQGGGSYGGFYSDLLLRNEAMGLPPLRVSKIAYASPGEIELSGDDDVLRETTDAIDVFTGKAEEIWKAYRFVYTAVQREGLLAAGPDAEFSSKAIEAIIRSKTKELASLLQLEEIEIIEEACGGKTLVFSKVIMSIERRAKELYAFSNEGRITT